MRHAHGDPAILVAQGRDAKGRAARIARVGSGDAAIGVEVMRLCEAATQVEDRILHREGFVGANTEFTARNGLLGEEHEAALAKRRYTIDRSEWFASVYGAS